MFGALRKRFNKLAVPPGLAVRFPHALLPPFAVSPDAISCSVTSVTVQGLSNGNRISTANGSGAAHRNLEAMNAGAEII